MRLVDLAPRWVGLGVSKDAIGITFKCPHCLTQRIGVMFSVPVRRGDLPTDVHWADHPDIAFLTPGQKAWTREGDTFDTLTLSPSIDTSAAGHWHGFIRNGEAA